MAYPQTGGNQVDANGRELQRQIFRKGGHRSRHRRDECESLGRATAARATDEE
jgi:hypothetical protein